MELESRSRPVTQARVQVEADMSHAGMAPVFSEAREIRPGVYQTAIDFSMAGDWVLLLHIRMADGRRAEQQIDVRDVRETAGG